ncbi:AAA family ATPase [Pedobacter sp. KR3-3]|uniref:AAA family ATPase n=1 Tax=Pedobacter albus TaxID=3113905 RepID=A0ABU7I4R6_9SPHI|nr:AAA family ATPase [Pedobacter sp. KR3-3]MEE1944458.1 AAA family ATPase [Pedobacter sp. KR3-3]
MIKEEIIECINFFNSVEVSLQDITNVEQSLNKQKVVLATYQYKNATYVSKPLYYKEIGAIDNIRDIDKTHAYFEDEVYILDLDRHGWPQPSGKSNLDRLVIDDITNDGAFVDFLKLLANNKQKGYIQRITKDGRTAQYYHNLENNNHWHDLVLLIKEVIKSQGGIIDKSFFKPLIFNWNNEMRVTLAFNKYGGLFSLVHRLYENIKLIQMELSIKRMKDLLLYKKQIILQGPPGTGKTRLAKEIAKQIIGSNSIDSKTISTKNLTKDYIQSHLPVKQKIKGKNNVEFEVVGLEKNIVLLKSDTSKAWRPSYTKIIESFNRKLWEVKGRTGGFTSYEDAIAKFFYENHFDNIDEIEEKVIKEKDFLNIIQFHPSYSYEDFVRGIVALPNEGGEGVIFQAENKTLLRFAETANNDSDNSYILIIDEINRANLSSVLGELIYALEYRDEEVESLYDIDGSNKFVLPKNLYIIGTMNTADRSVGHIDYAIRRRFAFVDVLPKDLTKENGTVFKDSIFKRVTSLFVKDYDPNIDYSADDAIIKRSDYLTSDFEPKDVWLGHSYFIQQYQKDQKGNDDLSKPIDFSLRIKYEIKPILEEYIKDGILKETAREVIKNLA